MKLARWICEHIGVTNEWSKGGLIMAQAISFNLNGRSVTVQIDDPEMPLLYALRDDLGLHGPRFGCGLNQCGACTVHLEGKAIRSCVTPVSTVAHRRVVTLEGLVRSRGCTRYSKRLSTNKRCNAAIA
jgi:aerobic-type carbon monoxide dehydrogenase small subunit (CoxS/CutS family)